MQDPNPLPWGAQDRFQAHYIVRKQSDTPLDLTARTVLQTSGHFGSKKVTSVRWEGGKIADTHNNLLIMQKLLLILLQKVLEYMEIGKVALNLIYPKFNLRLLIK